MRKTWLLAAALAVSTLGGAACLAADTVVVVVRHAEKATDDPQDPVLTPAGIARAEALASVLAQSELDAIYSTQFKRTVQTATPSATRRELKVQVREANADNAATHADAQAREIREKHAGQTVLIVGHSNTVPGLVKALSGKDIAPIADDEYDRLYVITLGDQPRVVEARYGD